MRRSRPVLCALGIGVALAVSACSGTSDAVGSASALANNLSAAVEAGSAAMESLGNLPSDILGPDLTDPAVAATTPAEAPVTRTIGKTGWYDGFVVTVVDATAERSYGNDVEVTVDLSYQNTNIDEDTPSSADVEVNGLTVEGDFDSPRIPAGGKAKGTGTFTVFADTKKPTLDEALDQVTLTYGDASDNQTLIPLAEDAKVQSQEPKDLAVTGNLTQGQIVVDVVKGKLAPSYESGEKGQALLDLRVKLTCAADCIASGWNTGVEQFSITGPDGNSVVADSRSEYCCDALYPGTVSDGERNVLTFVVASPGTGKYTLTYNNPNITSSGIAPATFEFTA